MENENRLAPDLIRDLIAMPQVSYTVQDIENLLGVSRKRARAVLAYGVAEDLLRMVLSHNDDDRQFALYEKAGWRREWITKSWGCGGQLDQDNVTCPP